MAEAKRQPKPRSTSNDREFTVILEDLRSQFRTFGEGLGEMRGRIAAVEAELRDLRESHSFHKLVADHMQRDLSSLNTLSRKMTADIGAIREDIRTIKDDLKAFDSRIEVVETKIGL